MIATKRNGLWVAGAMFLLAACAGPMGGGPGADPIGGVTPDGLPMWANKGSGAFTRGGEKAFYGVGLVQGVQNEALARQTADNRARGEIAKIFDTYVAALMKDYQRSTTAGDFKGSAEEQDVISVQKTVTETTVRGIEIRDHWRNPRDGTLYALAVLPLKRVMQNMNTLSPSVRDNVRANAEKAFADLDKELQKRSERADPAPAATPTPAAPEAPVVQPEPAAPAVVAAPRKKGKLLVGMQIKGRERKRIQTCFASSIVGAGFELLETSNKVDVMIKGSVNFKRHGVSNGAMMVTASLDTRVIDMQSGKTIAASQKTIKVGRPTLNQALQSATSKLCKLVTPDVVNKIKVAFSR
ncbi:MAG: hypothetical protein JRH20_19990 [Deltaproteobacteria bacterium]|nr:hypothetical protein [Deltaproteobacteria bacterium]